MHNHISNIYFSMIWKTSVFVCFFFQQPVEYQNHFCSKRNTKNHYLLSSCYFYYPENRLNKIKWLKITSLKGRQNRKITPTQPGEQTHAPLML